MSSPEGSKQASAQHEEFISAENDEDLPKILVLGKTQQGKSTFIKSMSQGEI